MKKTATAKTKNAPAKTKAQATRVHTPAVGGKDENYVNVAKFTTEAEAVNKLVAIVGNKPIGKYSPFGHLLTSDSGKIDMALLNGNTTLSGLSAVTGTSKTSKKTRESEKAQATRVRNHVGWEADTATVISGFPRRLKNVWADAKEKGKACKPWLDVIAAHIRTTFSATYGRAAKANK